MVMYEYCLSKREKKGANNIKEATGFSTKCQCGFVYTWGML